MSLTPFHARFRSALGARDMCRRWPGHTAVVDAQTRPRNGSGCRCLPRRFARRQHNGERRSGGVAMMKKYGVAFVMFAVALGGCKQVDHQDAQRTTEAAFASAPAESTAAESTAAASTAGAFTPDESVAVASAQDSAVVAPKSPAQDLSKQDRTPRSALPPSIAARRTSKREQHDLNAAAARAAAPAPAETEIQAAMNGAADAAKTPALESKLHAPLTTAPEPRAPRFPARRKEAVPALAGEAAQPLSAASPPSEFASVDEARAKMLNGNVVFNVPTPVDVDNSCPCRIDVVLSPTRGLRDLQKLIVERNPDAGNFEHAQIQISDRMTAQLTADPDDFVVDPKGDQEQAVGTVSPVIWSWTITPNHWGRHTLQLVLKALVTMDGQPTPIVLTTLDKSIQVTVTPFGRVKRFFAGNWQWIWTTLLAPLALGLWKYRRRFAH
ncbi:ornithine cyclodeaminase [Burkholderia oklahomensis]|uniref:ornithine cyclodeaminase n=1 Tax=Burkholderia oklahomensis TaxID=342113 RepID=UPI00264EC112|nr:ornithine cyclodeaminase [Burkholderia oklahomensis]MDN7673373.1 ornithine cyclodeaminase [Burkholderia oklahomensis]